MEELAGRGAVVTGAASGIGAALARALAREGMHLALADVEVAPLEALAAELRGEGCGEVAALRADVSRREDVEALAEAAFAALGGVHLLCNNAGVCQGGPVHALGDADWAWLLGVNFHGVRLGCSVFVPRLLEQGQPAHILNTASVGGFLSGGGIGMYTTTKYAVVGYSEALAQELAPHGIGVSILCPSFTRTRLGEADRNRPAELGTAPAGLEMLAQGLAEGLSPDLVARHALRGIRENALYVFTDRSLEAAVASRFERVRAALERAGEPPG